MQQEQEKTRGYLAARPKPTGESSAPVGLHPLELDIQRDGFLYVPQGYQPTHPMPLVLMLHGAGGTAHGTLSYFLPSIEQIDFLLLVPQSRQQTWDAIEHGTGVYNADVSFIERALEQTFSRYAVDASLLAIGGFSDGASYALSLGLMNGDLFNHIIAFSPGFLSPLYTEGKPRIFISHGRQDPVLPIDRCSRKIVPLLQHNNYDIHYHEFDGMHAVPLDIIHEAWRWFLDGYIPI